MKKILLAVNCTLLVLLSHAQDLEKALRNFVTQNPQEKVYIHYDREYYSAGETIWFKAYFFHNGLPSMLSSNFYMQLINGKGELVDKKMYAVAGGSVRGSIDLPDSIPGGNYYIRGVTTANLKGDEAFSYHRNIYVGGYVKPVTNSNTENKLSVQFFPESGNLVDGILTTVAFKAIDGSGKPVEVSGKIEGIEIPFKSYHDGMGKFQLRPKAGQNYFAEVKFNGASHRVSLPAVQTSGINLKVQDEKGGKLFQLTRSENDRNKYSNVQIVVQLNNTIVYDNPVGFDDYLSVKGHLLTDSLPSGILHFTVFNDQMIPIAERLAFVDNGEYKTSANFTLAKSSLTKRSQNTFQLALPEKNQSSLSISVTDASAVQLPDRENIYSRVLLTSDLKGYVWNPAYYFEKKSDSTREAMDNLMLTHGWSRFQWTKIIASQNPAMPAREKYLISLAGSVQDTKDKRPASGGNLKIYLEDEDSSAQSFDIPVDAQGRFFIDSLLFNGRGRFYYTYVITERNGAEKIRNVSIKLDEDPNQPLRIKMPFNWQEIAQSLPVISMSISPQRYTVPKSGDEVKEMEEVVLLAKNKRPTDVVNEKYASGIYENMGKVVADNINNPPTNQSLNVINYIEQSIPTIKLQGGKFVNTRNFSLRNRQMWEVGVLLNESLVTLEQLRSLTMADVALIKMYDAGFPAVGSQAPGGALAIYTRNFEEKPKEQFGEQYFTYNGYSVVKQFYHPDYSVAKPEHGRPDYRSTLYWNPSVFTNAEKSSFDFSFYNNDVTKKFRVVIEGFDSRGKMVHVERVVE